MFHVEQILPAQNWISGYCIYEKCRFGCGKDVPRGTSFNYIVMNELAPWRPGFDKKPSYLSLSPEIGLQEMIFHGPHFFNICRRLILIPAKVEDSMKNHAV